MAFGVFHSWLTPTATESAAAKSHRNSIYERLVADFKIEQFFRSGSFGNGTSVRAFSDVDYFAVIPIAIMPLSSATALQRVNAALSSRFPLTGVHIDGPAVVVPFGVDASETTEIVPAEWRDVMGANTIYQIPDGRGGWMRSGPLIHKGYIDRIDALRGGRLKPLIRFIKAWKYYTDLQVSSFYLEMRTAAYASTETSIIHDIDIAALLEIFSADRFSDFVDPTGVSGLITAGDALATFMTSGIADVDAQRARAAVNARLATPPATKRAFELWDQVFRGKFPVYA